MTKYKALHRAVHHLGDYELNGRIARRGVERWALEHQRNARNFSRGTVGQCSAENFAGPRARPMAAATDSQNNLHRR